MGRGNGDIDTVSLIDVTPKPFRTVETVSVGHSPEGLKFSPDGKFLAVANIEGSTKPASSPFYHDYGRLVVFAVGIVLLEFFRWLFDVFGIGATFYGSAPLYAPDDKDGTLLLKPGQEGYSVIGEAYAALRYQDYVLVKGYRQLVDQPYINPIDNRMTPNTFEGLTAGGTVDVVQYFAGYLWNALVLACLSGIGVLIVALPAAYAFSRLPLRAKPAWMLAVLAFQMVSPLVIMVPLYRYMSWLGLVNSLFGVTMVYVALGVPLAWPFYQDFRSTPDHGFKSTRGNFVY